MSFHWNFSAHLFHVAVNINRLVNKFSGECKCNRNHYKHTKFWVWIRPIHKLRRRRSSFMLECPYPLLSVEEFSVQCSSEDGIPAELIQWSPQHKCLLSFLRQSWDKVAFLRCLFVILLFVSNKNVLNDSYYHSRSSASPNMYAICYNALQCVSRSRRSRYSVFSVCFTKQTTKKVEYWEMSRPGYLSAGFRNILQLNCSSKGESSGLENDEIFVLTCEHSRHTQHNQHTQH